MSRKEYHDRLDQLLDLIEKAPSGSNEQIEPEQAAKVCDFSVRFLDWVVGDFIAHQIYAGGHSYFRDEIIRADDTPVELFNKRALAVAIDIFSPFLEKAKVQVCPLQRDLIEMSKSNGSDPFLLTYPVRGKGKKNNRDLKLAAQKRVCKVVYQEHGRTGASITETRNRLRNSQETEAERKAWDRMVKVFSKERRSKAILEGSKLIDVPDDAEPSFFRRLWQLANMK